MAIVMQCDGPSCSSQTQADRYHGSNDAWIRLEAAEDEDDAQFCSWSCLAALAVARAVDREGPTTNNPKGQRP